MDKKIIIITAFDVRVQIRYYGRECTVRVPSITKVLATISEIIELAGEQIPIYRIEMAYKTPVEWILEEYRREDPTSTP